MRPSLPLALILFLAAGPAPAAGARTHTVLGQDDDSVDRAAIQAAVDRAEPGDTVLLSGTFRLDGVPIAVATSQLSIVGEAIDDDGDGLANEDPADGVDDDGDGLVDEDDWDTILIGVDDGSGGPALDAFPDRFNDGFQVLGFDDDLDHLSFRHLKFERLNRAIYLFPDYDDAGTVLLCDATTPTAGSLRRVTVEGSSFHNGFRGVELLGRIDRLSIRDNRFDGLAGAGVLLFGKQIGCAEADGSIVELLPLGTPERTDIADNRMTSAQFGVLSFISSETSVRRNVMAGGLAGVGSLDDEGLSIAHGEISGAAFGVLASRSGFGAAPGSDNSITHNELSENLYGVLIDCTTTGYTIVDNAFQGSLVADVVLDGTAPGGACAGIGDSHDNTVIVTDPATSVLDFGADNRILGVP